MSITQRQVILDKCMQYEWQNNRKKPLVLSYPSKTKNENMPCQCMYCGKYLDILTNEHAIGDGFADKDAIIKAGYIRVIRRKGG